MAIRLSQEHWSTVDDVKYKVEVHDNAWAGAVSSFDDNFFEITWDNEDDDFLAPIKASSCRYVLFDDDSATFAAFRATLAAAEENRFTLVISKWNGASYDLHWVGVIMTDMVSWNNENSPREFEILAKDGLNRISTILFDNINSSPYTTAPQTLIYTITQILAKNSLAAFHTGDYIKVSQDWYEVQMSATNPQRNLELTRLWGEMFRKEQPANSDKRSDIEPMYCDEVLKGILRLFSSRIIYSEGAYHIQQVSNFTTDTYSEAVYDNTGTYASLNSGVTIKSSVNGTTFKVLDNGKFGYHAAYKRAKLTAKGFLDLKGAYIDKIEVNRATTTVTQTLLLGTILGGVYATATVITTGISTEFKAQNAGTDGNSIALIFTGINSAITAVSTWNTANPTNQVLIVGGSSAVVHAAGTTTLSGGDGSGDRKIEIDFDLNNATTNKVKASNIITTVDVKLICGSYRIKNKPKYTNQGDCDWTTTAADKWTFTQAGYNTNTSKIQIVTDEIPFAEETGCTLEITITLTKKNAASWIDASDPTIWPTNTWDYYAVLRALRVIAWDYTIDTLADVEVISDNPTYTNNSLEFDFGKILIGDNPLVQSSISSKNYLEIYNSLGTWKRSNVWAASFDTDYGLVTTMLMEAIALRKQPTEKYMGAFRGDYAAWKSIGYDSGRWVLNTVKYSSRSNEWEGSWWKINYSRADITKSEERLNPPTSTVTPYRLTPRELPAKNNNPVLINGKGTGATPYEAGMTAITAIDVDALDNKLFRSGDSAQVYHPTTRELLDTFVVDSDTTVSATSISVTSQSPAGDIPVGAILKQNEKEVVASDKVRADQSFTMQSQWVNFESLDETDFTGSSYQVTIEQQYLVFLLPSGTYNVYLPLGSTCLKYGKSIILTVKCITNFLTVYPHATDTSAGAEIVTNGGLSSLILSGGQNISFIWDGTDWQRIGL
jgi:hypothetical protein